MGDLMGTGDLLTLLVALGTFALAYVTWRQGRLSASSLDLSIRPFLADPSPSKSGEEELQFGAPGRIMVRAPRGSLFYQGAGDGAFFLSVAFENTGAGLAAIQGAELDVPVTGDVFTSRRFVPAGELVRVNVSILTEIEGAERFRDQWWAMEGLAVSIHYTDANGRQPMVSRATIRQAATRGPWVEEISVSRVGSHQPITVGRGSY
jgi:hypothetical protein